MKIKINENQLKKLIQIISEEEGKKLNVLFVGDSLSSEPNYTWNYLLANNRSNDWVSNHIAERGKTTKWMKDEVSKELKKKKYDIVFVYGGTNDIFNGLGGNSAKNNLKNIIDMVAEQGGKTYIYSGYDAKSMSEKLGKKRNDMISFQESLNDLNTTNSFVIPPTYLEPNLFEPDKTHITGKAHNKIANTIDSYIRKNKLEIKKTSFLDRLINFKKDNVKTNMVDELLGTLNDFKSNNQKIEYKGTIISSQDVFDIQTALQLLGYSLPIWGIDGKFGPETEKAVKAFQTDLDLDINGIVDGKMIDNLIKKIKDKNINNSDFEKLQIEKTSSDTEEFDDKWFSFGEFDSEFKANINNSIISSFKNMLETYDLNYSDFENDCESIGLDPEIAIKQIWIESIALNPKVINCQIKSPVGAMGLTQFMPGTWSHYGGGTNPCEPKNALNAYFKYMKDLMKMFPNRIDLVLAGYNHGPNRQMYSNAFKNNISFKELENTTTTRDLPKETREYVNGILKLN